MTTKNVPAKKAKEETALALPEGVDLDAAFDDADQLNPRMEQGDLAMPFIMVLQAQSPECIRGHSKAVEGAQAGMFISKVDKTIHEAIEFVPAHYERRWVEWKPRDQGGGRIADYHANDPIQREIEWKEVDGGNRPMLPNGNMLVETGYQFILWRPYGSDQEWEFGVLPCKGTMLKKSKAMNSIIAKQKATNPKTGRIQALPRWVRKWKATTRLEEKDGNSWYNIEFEPEGMLSNDDGILYAMGKDVAVQASSMAYDHVLAGEDDGVVSAEDKQGAIDVDPETDEVPF